MVSSRLLISLAALLIATALQAADMRVPACTAYLLPNPDGARVSEREGVTRWRDPAQSVNWYGRFARAGELTAKVEMRLPPDNESRFKLTVGGQAREATIRGTNDIVVVDFGAFRVTDVGYQRIVLETAQ